VAAQLAAQLGASSRALLEARSTEAQLQALPRSAPAAVRKLAERIEEFLEPGKERERVKEGRREPPRALPQIQAAVATLYAAVMRSDAAPTQAQRIASESAASGLAVLLAQWQALAGQLPALNLRLRAAGLPAISPGIPPPADLDSVDVDED
jgi:hypothetical protein